MMTVKIVLHRTSIKAICSILVNAKIRKWLIISHKVVGQRVLNIGKDVHVVCHWGKITAQQPRGFQYCVATVFARWTNTDGLASQTRSQGRGVDRAPTQTEILRSNGDF